MSCIMLTISSNYSTAHSNIGYFCTLVLNLSVLLPLQNNSYSNNLALCLTNSCSCQSQFSSKMWSLLTL